METRQLVIAAKPTSTIKRTDPACVRRTRPFEDYVSLLLRDDYMPFRLDTLRLTDLSLIHI